MESNKDNPCVYVFSWNSCYLGVNMNRSVNDKHLLLVYFLFLSGLYVLFLTLFIGGEGALVTLKWLSVLNLLIHSDLD